MNKPKCLADLDAETWAACDNLWIVQEFFDAHPVGWSLSGGSLDRRLRLLLVGALRAVWHHLTDPRSRAAVEASERYADHRDPAPVDAAYGPAEAAMDEAADAATVGSTSTLASRLTAAAWDILDADLIEDHKFPFWVRVLDGLAREAPYPDCSATECRAIHVALFHDIFGNPFRPVALDPAWLTTDVLALARGIYEERAFDRMPILADALQDAGCDSDDVLNHCRGAGPHVRGCWVIDLILGKT